MIVLLVSSVIQDIDVISFYGGIPDQSMWGHRGFTHSILFALLWAVLMAFLFFKKGRGKVFGLLFLATLSHDILDATTTGGIGVGFFVPFSPNRYFFPFRPNKPGICNRKSIASYNYCKIDHSVRF